MVTSMASAAELIQIEVLPRKPAPKPDWLKARAPMGENYHNLKTLARKLDLASTIALLNREHHAARQPMHPALWILRRTQRASPAD